MVVRRVLDGLVPVLGVLGLSLGLAGCSSSAENDEVTLGDAGDLLTMSISDGGNEISTSDTDNSGSGGLLDVSTTGEVDTTAETGEACDQDVDIVFVMDVSTTMGPFLDQLEAEISVVSAALAALELPGEAHYGLVVFVDDYLIANGGVPYTDVELLRADFEMWNTFTASNQQTGGGGANTTWTENSLDGLYAAASAFQWRPADTTLRMVIHTTDDTFWDGPVVGNGIQIDHGYAETVDALQAGTIRMFAFAALIGGQVGSDDVSMGWSTPYMGMDSIPEATGGAFWNIDEVLGGTVSLSASIDQAIEDSLCEPYPPID